MPSAALDEKRAKIVSATMDVLARFFPIMFDDNRLKVLICLASWLKNNHVMSYSQIAEFTNISDGAVLTYTLRLLQEDGLVFNQREGRNSFYGLTPLGMSVARFSVQVIRLLRATSEYKRYINEELQIRGVSFKEVAKALDEIEEKFKEKKIPLEPIYTFAWNKLK
ncbi:MAG: winged helix-turn-helix transcriptional regulator [Thaumarchaeota archaeon]|jgi:predicted MarR family transcription regulator|nr:winged helix-turn-helix transcriptional regulator [Nitrososphaerota archaeon]